MQAAGIMLVISHDDQVTTLNELQSCRRGNSYGDGNQKCWFVGTWEIVSVGAGE